MKITNTPLGSLMIEPNRKWDAFDQLNYWNLETVAPNIIRDLYTEISAKPESRRRDLALGTIRAANRFRRIKVDLQ